MGIPREVDEFEEASVLNARMDTRGSTISEGSTVLSNVSEAFSEALSAISDVFSEFVEATLLPPPRKKRFNPLTCKLQHRIMTDPVIAPDGCTYERSAITNYLNQYGVSPITGE